MRFVLALVALVAWSSNAHAWDAKVFQGENQVATAGDLMPHFDAADGTFYSEDYNFTCRLQGTVRVHLKLGMSTVLGGKGSAFVDGYVKIPRRKKSRVRKTFAKGKWSADRERFAIDAGGVRLSGTPEKLQLTLATPEAVADLELSAAVPGFKPGDGRIDMGDNGFMSFALWPRMVLRGKVTATSKRGAHYVVRGSCIVTHAASTLAPQHMPERWYYFLNSDGDKPVLFQAFQLREEFGGQTFGWAVAVDKTRYLLRTHRLTATPAQERDTRGRKLPWSLLLAGPDDLAGAVQGSKLTRVVDRLKGLPKLQAAIVRKFVSPKRYHFKGELELAPAKGKRVRTRGEFKIETMR